MSSRTSLLVRWAYRQTLEDAVEFFNLILETQLSSQEKADLVAFLTDPGMFIPIPDDAGSL